MTDFARAIQRKGIYSCAVLTVGRSGNNGTGEIERLSGREGEAVDSSFKKLIRSTVSDSVSGCVRSICDPSLLPSLAFLPIYSWTQFSSILLISNKINDSSNFLTRIERGKRERERILLDIFTKEGRVVIRLIIDCVALREIGHGWAHVLAPSFRVFRRAREKGLRGDGERRAIRLIRGSRARPKCTEIVDGGSQRAINI